MNAEILSVGTELLLGGTVNTDARDISLALAELGVNVYWHTVVGDNPARLTECLYRATGTADTANLFWRFFWKIYGIKFLINLFCDCFLFFFLWP